MRWTHYGFKTSLGLAITLVGLSPLAAQRIDVNAGATDVEVGQEGVVVDTDRRPTRQSTASDQSQVGGETGSNAELAENRVRGNQQDRLNSEIIEWVVADQRAIVDLAQTGLRRATTDEVRRLAEKVVRDHESFIDQLEGLTPETRPLDSGKAGGPAAASAGGATTAERPIRVQGDRASASAATEKQSAAPQRKEEPEETAASRLESLADRIESRVERLSERAVSAADRIADVIDPAVEGETPRTRSTSPWVDIHRSIVEQVSDIAEQDLEKREGKEFDGAFVGMLSATHFQEQATLQVLSRHASGTLRERLQEMLAIAKQHKNEAEQVMQAIYR